jgi:hypothetical protein
VRGITAGNAWKKGINLSADPSADVEGRPDRGGEHADDLFHRLYPGHKLGWSGVDGSQAPITSSRRCERRRLPRRFVDRVIGPTGPILLCCPPKVPPGRRQGRVGRAVGCGGREFVRGQASEDLGVILDSCLARKSGSEPERPTG